MVVDRQRALDDLFSFEIAQIDHSQAGVGLVVDEDELAVVITLRFTQGRMVGIAPRQRLPADAARVEHLYTMTTGRAVSPALPRLRCEDGDGLEDTHGG